MKKQKQYPTINDVQLSGFPGFSSGGGTLTAYDFSTMPFKPIHCFSVVRVDPGEIRGKHAHLNTSQLMICLNGTIQVTCRDLYEKFTKYILKPGDSILVPYMVWSEEIYYTRDTSLLVFWDRKYSKEDYINSWQEYLLYIIEELK